MIQAPDLIRYDKIAMQLAEYFRGLTLTQASLVLAGVGIGIAAIGFTIYKIVKHVERGEVS
jgi:hypothetical protein